MVTPPVHRFVRSFAIGAFAASFAFVVQSAQALTPPWHYLPGDATIQSAVNDQSQASVAAGSDRLLAVWSDNRANGTGGGEVETSRDVYGMLLDGAGSALSAVPFAISAGPAAQEFPRAAWNGSHWLVVFESTVMSPTGYYQKALEAVRVSPTGVVVDTKPIRIFNLVPVGATWAVASDGSGWVIVHQGTSTSGDLVALRITGDGTLLDPSPKSLVPATYYLRGGLHLAYASGVFLLAYEESMTGSDPTRALRFDAALDPLDPAPLPLAPAPLARLASNGAGFYAVWTAQQPDFTMAVIGSRIGTNGQKLDGAGLKISGANSPQANTITSVAWDGSNWKATWGGANGTRVARVSAAGQLLDAGGVLVTGIRTGLSASAGNGTVELVWPEIVDSSSEVFAQQIGAGNAAGALRTLSVGPPAQLRADVATSGNGWMIVYRSSTGGRHRVLAQALDAAGVPVGSEPVELDSTLSVNYPGTPAVAWNGTSYLATWGSSSGIVAKRLQTNGTPLDAAPFQVLATSFGPADVAALGDTYLVVGLRCGYTCQYIFPVAARVNGSGVVLDPSPIAMGVTYASTPRVVALGGRWLVVWQDNATHDNSSASTLGTFIDASGIKVPDFGIHGPYSSAGGNGIFTIGLASSGATALMVQSQELTSGVETDLLARRISADGTISGSVNLTPWAGDQYRPRVAWDGSQFVVVWQDQKAALDGDWGLEMLDARSDLYGMRITPAGAIVDPQGFLLSNSALGEAFPDVGASAGTTLVAASLVRNDSSRAGYRIGTALYGAGGNRWPVARAAATPTAATVPVTVGFESTGSSDPDGSVASYSWSFGDGATSTEPTPSHTYLDGGPFVATLTVTDDGGAWSAQEMLLELVAPNQPPVAFAASDRSSGPAPLDVVFSAAGSYDPDGWIGNIRWQFGDGSESWGATAYHTFYETGTYTVTVTCYDGSNATGSDSVQITVGQPLPPAAPSNLTAIAFTSDWLNVTWTDNSNSEDGFTLERCAGSAVFCSANPGQFAVIATTGANIDYHGDTGLPAATTFTYRVRAFNVSGASADSNLASATTLGGASVPAAPTGLTAALGSTGAGKRRKVHVDLSWVDNAANETSYVVERCKGASCTAFAPLATLGANAVGYRDSAVTVKSTYRYRVLARNAAGDSPASNVVAVAVR